MPSIAEEKVAISCGAGIKTCDLALKAIEDATNLDVVFLLENHNPVLRTCQKKLAEVPVDLTTIQAPFGFEDQRNPFDVVSLELEPNKIVKPLAATVRWRPAAATDLVPLAATKFADATLDLRGPDPVGLPPIARPIDGNTCDGLGDLSLHGVKFMCHLRDPF